MIKVLAKRLLRNFNCAQKTHLVTGVRHRCFGTQSEWLSGIPYLHYGLNTYCFSTKDTHKKDKPSTKKLQSSQNQRKPKYQTSKQFIPKTNKHKPAQNRPKTHSKHKPLVPQRQKPHHPPTNPKITQLNTQIQSFIHTHTKPLTTPGITDEIPIQIPQKITTQTLSNLYRLILIKGEFLGVNVRQGLSHENKLKIEGLLKAKESGIEQLGNKGNQVVKWSLTDHEEMCDVIYLSAMVGERRIHNNIKAEFMQYLANLPSIIKTPDDKLISTQFIFTQSQSTKIPNHPKKQTLLLPITIPNLFPVHTILTNPDSIAFEIIKSVAQNRSINQMIDAMKALTRLLTVKQLRSLDDLLVDKVLAKTEKEVGKSLGDAGNMTINYESANKVMTLDEVIKLASILSQLSLNGRSIKKCESIFSRILHQQTTNFTQLLTQLPKNLSSNGFPLALSTLTPLLKFDQIMRMYIAVGQLGAVDRDLQYLMEKLFVVKLRIRLMIEEFETSDKVGSLGEFLVKYSMSEREVSILLSTLHKFKKGSEVTMIKSLSSSQSSHQTSNPTPYQNIWLSIYQFYTSPSHTFPSPLLFSLLSGIYRSFTPLIMHSLYDLKIRQKITSDGVYQLSQVLDQALGALVKKLYEADEELSYLAEWKMEKLIEFVIVGQMAMMAGVVQELKALMKGECDNSNKLTTKLSLKTSTHFYSLMIDRTLAQIQQNKHQSSPQLHNNQPSQQQFSPEPQLPQTKKQLKQKQEIYSLLQFILLYTKAHVEVMTIKKGQQKDDKKRIEDMIGEVRDKLRKVGINEQMMVLVTALIGHSRLLGQGIGQLCGNKQQQGQPSAETLKHISQNMLTLTNTLQSFIGFTSQPTTQYTTHLQTNLLTSSFPHISESQQHLKQLRLHLLQLSPDNTEFICEKFLANIILLNEEMVRVKLIRDQGEFRQYQNMVAGNLNEQEQQ